MSNTRWVVTRITTADNPPGFYLVHLHYAAAGGSTKSLVLGAREFADLKQGARFELLSTGDASMGHRAANGEAHQSAR